MLYLNGKKNGESEFFRPDGSLEKTVEYEDGYKHGAERYYNDEGLIITIIRYSYDNIIDTENINRTDRYGQKQGIWKSFHPNFQLKTYASYLDGQLHGYYREYNMKGELKKTEYYIRGVKQDLDKQSDTDNAQNTEYKKLYYSDGVLKSEGSYADTVPIGIHKFYDTEGKFRTAAVFDSAGIRTAAGKFTSDGKRVGAWKEFFADGSIKAKGEYKNDQRHGPWEFYFPDGSIEQKGIYNSGKPNGNWQWYYRNRKLRRSGTYRNGSEHGEFIEYTQIGDTLSFGYYSEGYKQGEWVRKVNGRKFVYPYNYGMKDGTAREYYSDGTLAFEGGYVSDMPDGEHVYFYPNGNVKLRASYFSGQRTGKWYRYDSMGMLQTVTEYKNDRKIKIDGNDLDIDN
jgi:antitoxin component YwqK of YwqJK toxin-antitoxin module